VSRAAKRFGTGRAIPARRHHFGYRHEAENGWEVLSQLKRDPRTAHIPLIVVSMVDQPGMGTLLGADEYLVKPVDKATLLAALQRRAGIRPSPKRTRPILVVEDDTATREFIAEMLTAQGYPSPLPRTARKPALRSPRTNPNS